MKREEHPLTARLQGADGYVHKIYVRKMSGKLRFLRPRWKAGWGCWVVEDCGPQEVFFGAGEWTVTRPDPVVEAPAEGTGERELLPCPFCDTTAHVVAWPREFRGEMVAMIECFTDNCYAIVTAATPSEVVKAWNRRAHSSAPEAREGEAVAWMMRENSGFQWAFSGDAEDARLAKADGFEAHPLFIHPAAPSADKLRERLRDLMDMEFAKDWRTWSEDRATRLLGIGPRLDAFLAAREAALKADGA